MEFRRIITFISINSFYPGIFFQFQFFNFQYASFIKWKANDANYFEATLLEKLFHKAA